MLGFEKRSLLEKKWVHTVELKSGEKEKRDVSMIVQPKE